MEEFRIPNKPRCQKCDNKQCGQRGQYIKMEKGCKQYIPLDPLLCPPTYNRAAKRIRIKKTIKISPESNLFLLEHVMGLDRKIDGRVTRCVNFCLDRVRDAVDGEIVDIPDVPGYSIRGELVQISQTFTPDNWEWIEKIFKHYDEKKSLSWIVDYMIGVIGGHNE